jgi:hypothetical protein
LPPDRAPSGSAPVGVRPFSCSTDSDSSLQQRQNFSQIRVLSTRVADQDPTWIWIQEDENDPQKKKKISCFEVLDVLSLLSVEGLDVLYGGLGLGIL